MCVDGTRRSVREYRDCNWGQIPGDAVVTTSARGIEMRQKYQKFLTKLVEVFGSRTANPRTDIRNTTTFRPFDDFSSRDLNTVDSLAQPISPRGFQLFQSSPRYGMLNNLIFQDDSVSLKVLLYTYFLVTGKQLNFCFECIRLFQLINRPIQVFWVAR